MIVIVGGAGGIGSSITRELVQGEQEVFLIGRSEEPMVALSAEIGCRYARINAASFEQMESVFSSLVGQGKTITGVVNCAGSVLLKPAHLVTEDEWAEVLADNLGTAFSVLRAAMNHMEQGALVFFSSAAVRIGLANHEAIAAVKSGIEGMVRAAAATLAPTGIRVNAVAPGLTKTALTERMTDNEAGLRVSTKLHALGRIGQPQDIASAVCWLLDERQNWLTGQVIAVDGGLSTVRS